MDISEKLKELRKEKNVSQQELADHIFVSRSAVAKWENGLGLPCRDSLKLLCDYFEVDESSLLREGEKENVQKNRKIFKYKYLLIGACAVALVFIVLTITGLSLYFSGALAKSTRKIPVAYPEDFPLITVDGIQASGFYKTTPTLTEDYTAISAPIDQKAIELPLLPYKNVYGIDLPDDAILDQPRYYFLNDDYSTLTDEDNLALSALPRLPIRPAPLWFTIEYFKCAGVDSEKGEVKMNFRVNDFNVIIVEFKYYWREFSAISYYRVER